MNKLRQGRRVPRHLYRQDGPEPSDTDPPVGMVDTPELAATIVQAVNALHDRENGGYDPRTEVDAHWEGDREQLIAAWEHDQQRRIKYTELAEERARIRAAILTEIDDMDPDGHMRELLADPDRDGDPGIAGNSWWRAYCELSGMMRALNTIDNPGNDPVGQLAADLDHAERENRRLQAELDRLKR